MSSKHEHPDRLKATIQLHAGPTNWDGQLGDALSPPSDAPGFPFFKPSWGFWTSTETRSGESAWTRYLHKLKPQQEPRLWRYRIIGDPRILILRHDRDVERTLRQLGHDPDLGRNLMSVARMTGSFNDWLKDVKVLTEMWHTLATHFDAVHVPDDFDRRSALQMWDVESTVWFNPKEFLDLAY